MSAPVRRMADAVMKYDEPTFLRMTRYCPSIFPARSNMLQKYNQSVSEGWLQMPRDQSLFTMSVPVQTNL